MTTRPLPPMHCPVCGRYGNEEDLCVVGEPCPDEECRGFIIETPAYLFSYTDSDGDRLTIWTEPDQGDQYTYVSIRTDVGGPAERRAVVVGALRRDIVAALADTPEPDFGPSTRPGEDGHYRLNLELIVSLDTAVAVHGLLIGLGYDVPEFSEALDAELNTLCTGTVNEAGILQHPGDTCPVHDPETGPPTDVLTIYPPDKDEDDVRDDPRWLISGDLREIIDLDTRGNYRGESTNYVVRDLLAEQGNAREDMDPEYSCFFAYTATEADAIALRDAAYDIARRLIKGQRGS